MLLGNGFVLKPYVLCVASTVIDSSQCTISWHVDDNKISHADRKIVTNIIEMFNEHFRKMVSARKH